MKYLFNIGCHLIDFTSLVGISSSSLSKTPPGGIDLNPDNINLKITPYNNTDPLIINNNTSNCIITPNNITNINIEGLFFKIISIKEIKKPEELINT